jgi:hypothetical protein
MSDTLTKLAEHAAGKTNFTTLDHYFEFCKRYLDYIATDGKLQAVIVSQNDTRYRFFQYNDQAGYRVTRPINGELLYSADSYEAARDSFIEILQASREMQKSDAIRENINRFVYTVQQTVGAALDALPAGKANKARKVNGDLFERLILLIIEALGVNCRAGVVKLPIEIEGKEAFTMNYQHDLIVHEGEAIKVIGSVKTSSKDRIDKIFIDKFLHNRLLGEDTPHIAIFLNDVQRKPGKGEGQYKVGATFLPGHFKGYTVKLNPLDGVYYCDIRPNMRTEEILKDHIDTLDGLICDDIWGFVDS